MNQTESTIYKYKLEAASDEEFISKIDEFSLLSGPEVYTAVFKILAGIDIAEKDSAHIWRRALEHRLKLTKLLGRYVDITTALSDFLQTSTKHLSHPRLIETSSYENVVRDTIYDQLTGLFNRTYFDETFSQQLSLAKRYDTDLTILFLDIDNFKEVNDTYGHLAGDEVLKQTAAIINLEKRDSDIAARFGGEEFILLMSHTDSINAFILAERIRKEIEVHPFSHKDLTIRITISGGLASYPLNSDNPARLLAMADSALYLSKGAGKNRISHFKKEKRRYLRVKISQPILVKELDFKDSEPFTGKSKDICIGGILFENDQPLPIGALIKVKVEIGLNSSVLLIGKVVRIEKFAENRYDIGMTTSFNEMAKAANHEISAILHNNDGVTDSG
jgi:diguanylate cyclase (GGDEF)-like protein